MKIEEQIERLRLAVERITASVGSLSQESFLGSLESEVWVRDFGVRHGGTKVTIQNTVDELIDDYEHHHRQIEEFALTTD